MTQYESRKLSETEEKIIDAAIPTFVRYGIRKASMVDIAQAAGVSRQTLYDTFGDKNGLICAMIRTVTDRGLAIVSTRLEGCTSLAAQLAVYFEETISKSFDLLQTSDDVEDLISGHNASGKAEIADAHQRHEKLLTEVLQPYEAQLLQRGLSAALQAHFIVTVAMGLKYGAKSREDLDGLVQALTENTLSVTGASPDFQIAVAE